MKWDEQAGAARRGWPSAALAVLNGALPLGTYGGVHLRIHATLIVLIISVLAFAEAEAGIGIANAAVASLVMLASVLFHEIGHCVFARAVGGDAREIVLGPLGGLTTADAPYRPSAQFAAAAGGPLFSLLLWTSVACTLIAVGTSVGRLPWDLFHVELAQLPSGGWYPWLWWGFCINYALLLFNIVPLYPLDGGQMLQTILWGTVGYFRATNITCLIGMAGAMVLGVWGIVNLEHWYGLLMLLVAVSCFLSCLRQRQMLLSMGADAFDSGLPEEIPTHAAPRKLSRRTIRKARKQIQREQAEQAAIDAILAKVSERGMHSLTWREKRCLRKATHNQRKRDMELARSHRM